LTTVPQNTDSAYQACQEIARSHYENFPVASSFLPLKLRKPISSFYAFARTADDLADEGDLTAEQRLTALGEYQKRFEDIYTNNSSNDPVFIALSDTIFKFKLSAGHFTDLLSAFRQDVTKNRYANFKEVLSYCACSANPVGRLLLELVGINNSAAHQQSDAVCTALQLINFYQDIGQDYNENNRIYLACDEMQAANITEEQLAQKQSTHAFKVFMMQQIFRADNMLISGYPLCRSIGGRLGLELRMTIHAAHCISEKMLVESNVFTRPRLTKLDWIIVISKAIFNIKPKALNDYCQSARVS